MEVDSSQAQVVLDSDHHKIHKGLMFTFGDIVSIPSETSKFYRLITGSKAVHLRPARIVTSADKMTYSAYANTNYSGGSAVTILNRNACSLNVALSKAYKDPTGSTKGTRFAGAYIPGSAGVGGTRSGSETGEADELILLPLTAYLAEFYNGSSSVNIVSFTYNFYEA